MFEGESAPPLLSGMWWSIWWPRHTPVVSPVDGHGFVWRNDALACGERRMRPCESRAQPTHFGDRLTVDRLRVLRVAVNRGADRAVDRLPLRAAG